MPPKTPEKNEETAKVVATPYHYGTGRRKRAIAQVRVLAGTGQLIINDKPTAMNINLSRVLDMVGLSTTVDISAHVHGGGTAGQIIAIRHGLARALLEFNIELRATLKKAGFLTRDPREKERKKPGLHSARRAPQFSKR